MAEVTFENFRVGVDHVYDIGADLHSRKGVIPNMARVFNHGLSIEPTEGDIGKLIGLVGPDAYLQRNIDTASDTLASDRGAEEAPLVAIDWIERSRLLRHVERPFLEPDELPQGFSAAVIMGGVGNWMYRRAKVIIDNDLDVDHIVLAASDSGRDMVTGPGVVEPITQADYMQEIVQPMLRGKGYGVSLVKVGGKTDDQRASGDKVMLAAVDRMQPDVDTVVVPVNAGSWLQVGGLFRRAYEEYYPDSNFDIAGDQLFVVSDAVEIARTGKEDKLTHQNPLSALGLIPRNAQEALRHDARL